jgi:hypothetical protein
MGGDIFWQLVPADFIFIPASAVPVSIDKFDEMQELMADFGASKVRADKRGWYKVLGVYGGSEARAMQCFEFPRECSADSFI